MAGVAAVLAAAGRGERMRSVASGISKPFVSLHGRPMLAWALRPFQESSLVEEIVVVTAPGAAELCRESVVLPYRFTKVSKVVEGGRERQLSVRNGLGALSPETKFVAVHDGARPLLTRDLLDEAISIAIEKGAAVSGVPVKDTLKLLDDEGRITRTPDRALFWAVHTPQVFGFRVLMQAHEQAQAEGFIGTDDSSLVERMGFTVHMVKGSYENFKITTPEDLALAEIVLGNRHRPAAPRGSGEVTRLSSKSRSGDYSVGIGYDAHRLVIGRKLVIGGVDIPFERGLLGHSDADVLVHAVMDALLGAAGMGDIGRHFPDSSDAYKGISSMNLLRQVGAMLTEQGLWVNNIDAVVVAEHPRLAGYIKEMEANLAAALGFTPNGVNVKATTSEGMGFAGEGLGIAAYATVSIRRDA